MMLAKTPASALLRITLTRKWLPLSAGNRANLAVHYSAVAARTSTDMGSTSADLPPPPPAASSSMTTDMADTKTGAYGSSKSVFIRVWDGVNDMVEAFAVLRAVEREYGPFKDYRFVRDEDVPTTYRPYFLATFADRASWESVPADGTSFPVRLPPQATLPSTVANKGGVSLADIRSLLTPSPYAGVPLSEGDRIAHLREIEEAQGRNEKIVDVRVERADQDFRRIVYVDKPSIYRHHRDAMGRAFVAWAGFNTASSSTPSSSSSVTSTDSLQGASTTTSPVVVPVENEKFAPRMTFALAKWKGRLGASPYDAARKKGQKTEADTEKMVEAGDSAQLEAQTEDVLPADPEADSSAPTAAPILPRAELATSIQQPAFTFKTGRPARVRPSHGKPVDAAPPVESPVVPKASTIPEASRLTFRQRMLLQQASPSKPKEDEEKPSDPIEPEGFKSKLYKMFGF